MGALHLGKINEECFDCMNSITQDKNIIIINILALMTSYFFILIVYILFSLMSSRTRLFE